MNRFAARTVALLLAFILCLGTLSGITMTADAATTVDYSTGYVSSKYSNVIKNWGNRGETATYLSQNAEAFYRDNNTSYAQLSTLSGAASTGDVPNSELYKQLQSLMSKNHTTITSYNDTRDLYAYTDCENSGNPRTISSFYSGKAIGPDWDGGVTWNREHTWPNSKSATGSSENDIMMLRPTAKSENSSRGNTAYGESGTFYDPNEVSGEKYNLHGDVARIFLYVYVRWGILDTAWGSSGVMESKDVLLKWMTEDPVDTWELGRNDSVESITGTRNVFVDYPELAFKLFNAEVPAITTPSGEAGKTSAYKITAQSNNATYGTVSTNGSTITAVPSEGYEAAGYTVVSGTATVTRNGNQFTVSATSDCTIRIDFQARTAVSVSFLENGTTTGTQSAYVGDVITLPAASVTVSTDYTFLGWVTSELNETTAMPTFYSADSSYTLEGSTNFYALYSRTDASGSGTSSIFKLYSGEITGGDYLIVYNGAAMKAEPTSKPRLDFASVTVTDNCVNNPDPLLIWQISSTNNGWTLYNKNKASYAASTGTNSTATISEKLDDYSTWTVSGTETYDFVNKYNAANGKSTLLRKNGTYGFACYKDATGGPLTLYKAVSGTVYYTTTAGVIPALFEISCVSMNLGNSLSMIFYVPVDKVSEGDYALITKSYADGRGDMVVKVPLAGAQIKQFNGVNCYLAGFDRIAAKEMNDNVSCVVCHADGTPASKPYNATVKAYAEALLTINDAKLKTLMVDLLNYGAAAQKAFGYDTGNPANADLTEEQKGYATESIDVNALAYYQNISGIAPAEIALLLKNNTRLMLYYPAAGLNANMVAEITYTDHHGTEKISRVNVSDFGTDKAGKLCLIIDTLLAADYKTVLTVDIYNGTELVSSNEVNLVMYCALNPGYDASIPLAKYCQAAYNYLHKEA